MLKSYILPIITFLFICLFFESVQAQIDRPTGEYFQTRSEVIGQHGMVATSHPLATQIGLDILKKGGNAIDAAIGANAAMGLMEPTGNGIGGDLFAIIWHQESGKLYAINASGRSPIGLSYDQLLEELDELESPNRIPPSSLLSVSIPGAVDGWFELHNRFMKVRLLKKWTLLCVNMGAIFDLKISVHTDPNGSTRSPSTIADMTSIKLEEIIRGLLCCKC